jgi:hypothetical protein
LPDAESASGASTNARRQGHGGVNHDTAGADCRLDLLEQSGVALKRDSKYEEVGASAGGIVFFTRNLCLLTDCCLNFCCRFASAFRIPRSDNYGLA